jgi:hypothetical protein
MMRPAVATAVFGSAPPTSGAPAETENSAFIEKDEPGFQ